MWSFRRLSFLPWQLSPRQDRKQSTSVDRLVSNVCFWSRIRCTTRLAAFLRMSMICRKVWTATLTNLLMISRFTIVCGDTVDKLIVSLQRKPHWKSKTILLATLNHWTLNPDKYVKTSSSQNDFIWFNHEKEINTWN